jgi:hypothetical protein
MKNDNIEPRKAYEKPAMVSRQVAFGVFGDYSDCDGNRNRHRHGHHGMQLVDGVDLRME